MLPSGIASGVAGLGDSPVHAVDPAQATTAPRTTARSVSGIALGILVAAACLNPLLAGPIAVPNASFESPIAPRTSPYAFPDKDYWQKSAQPTWYDPSTNYNTPWDYLTGTFYNVPFPGVFIDNCDGEQAAFLFALPEVALSQDYNSVYGTNATPSHAFHAKFEINSAYRLTVGVMGSVYGSPPLYEGSTLTVSLYYRDASSNIVTVAATTVTNTADSFPTNTHFVDFSVYVPGVRPTDSWAGQYIGVQIASTVIPDLAGGYWDLDNVRLSETLLPALTEPRMTNSQFGFILQSQPGLPFEILATTNLALPASNWISLGTVTNDTGIISFLDPAPNPDRRFYRARQLP